jgi:hypothetical protein
MYRKAAHCIVILLILFFMYPRASYAQDVEARLYANAPVDMNFIAASYKLSDGEIMINSEIIEDFKGTINVFAAGYLRVFSLGGMTAKFDVLVPHMWMKASAKLAGEDTSRTWTGFGDPRFRLTLNFIGSPALSPAEFASYTQNTIIGASLQVIPPLGTYDPARMLNLGSNRWTFKPELALTQAIRKFLIELFASLFLFTDNTDYYGGSKLEQEHLGVFQVHVIYTFRPRLWISVNGLYTAGGETIVDGTFRQDFQSNSRIGATIAIPIAQQHNIKFVWTSGLTTRIGGDFDNFALAYFFNW